MSYIISDEMRGQLLAFLGVCQELDGVDDPYVPFGPDWERRRLSQIADDILEELIDDAKKIY